VRQENGIALLHALSGALAVGVSVWTRGQIPVATTGIRAIGFSLLGTGMLLFLVSAAYLGRAFLGEVAPTTNRLVVSGPYRYVRHPVYLGMLAATVGVVVALWSLWGLALVVFAVLPATLWRARREEAALARKFGREWEAYTARTPALLPWLGSHAPR
jgi:protein-S-isoprenylcysteine O-methyltransferase Ste14